MSSAARRGRPAVFIDKKGDSNQASKQEEHDTDQQSASDNGHTEIVRLLLQQPNIDI